MKLVFINKFLFDILRGVHIMLIFIFHNIHIVKLISLKITVKYLDLLIRRIIQPQVF